MTTKIWLMLMLCTNPYCTDTEGVQMKEFHTKSACMDHRANLMPFLTKTKYMVWPVKQMKCVVGDLYREKQT